MNNQNLADASRFVVLSGVRWGEVEPYSRIAPFDRAMEFMLEKLRKSEGGIPDVYRKPILKKIAKAIPRMLAGEVLAIVVSTSWHYISQVHGIYRDIEESDRGLMVMLNLDPHGKFLFTEYERRKFDAQTVKRYWAQAYEMAVQERP